MAQKGPLADLWYHRAGVWVKHGETWRADRGTGG
jgi:hypothetical protein